MNPVKIIDHGPQRITEPGFYSMTAREYHADPVAVPSLSASICTKIALETPLHAWTDHPRLNPQFEQDEGTPAQVKGTAIHKFLLGRGEDLDILEFNDYKTQKARDARENAWLASKTPILTKHYSDATHAAANLLPRLQSIDDCDDFERDAIGTELVMVWQDLGGIWCRAMIDRLTARGIVYDLKTSGRDLGTTTLVRKFEDGFDIQPAFYLRGLAALWPEMAGRFRWRWVFAEQSPPYAVRVEECGRFALKLGESRVVHAISMWHHCMKTGHWPGYAAKVGTLEPAEWTFNRWHERMLQEHDAMPLPPMDAAPDPLLIAGSTS